MYVSIVLTPSPDECGSVAGEQVWTVKSSSGYVAAPSGERTVTSKVAAPWTTQAPCLLEFHVPHYYGHLRPTVIRPRKCLDVRHTAV